MELKKKNGKIYKLSNNVNDKIYIGSTTRENINLRLIEHKSKYRKFLIAKHDHFRSSYLIFENCDIDNVKIEIIEEFHYDNINELYERERYHIFKNSNCVNMYIPLRDEKKYNIKIQCSCGKIIKNHHMRNHIKSKFHIKSSQSS